MANLNITGDLTVTGGGTLGGNSITTTSDKQTKGIKFNNGLIINWGRVTPVADGTVQTFAIPFTTTTYAVGATNETVVAGSIRAMGATNFKTTSFTAYGQWSIDNSGLTGGDTTFNWIAIGY